MEPLMVCLMALRSAQVQGRLMRVQSFRPRKVVSVQLLSSDLSYDCQVCSDAVVDEFQEWKKRNKKSDITGVVNLQCKFWIFVYWLIGFFGGKSRWIRKYKFKGWSACLYSHCLCLVFVPWLLSLLGCDGRRIPRNKVRERVLYVGDFDFSMLFWVTFHIVSTSTRMRRWMIHTRVC